MASTLLLRYIVCEISNLSVFAVSVILGFDCNTNKHIWNLEKLEIDLFLLKIQSLWFVGTFEKISFEKIS